MRSVLRRLGSTRALRAVLAVSGALASGPLAVPECCAAPERSE
jgi:hypothetical protein